MSACDISEAGLPLMARVVHRQVVDLSPMQLSAALPVCDLGPNLMAALHSPGFREALQGGQRIRLEKHCLRRASVFD